MYNIFEHPLRDKTRMFVQRLKVLEIKAGEKDYDFRSVVTEIEQYCRRNQVDIKLTYYIQLAFEELVQQLLMTRLNHRKVDVIVEYSAIEKNAVITALWDGPEFDPDSLRDDLSVAMLKKITSSFTYERQDSDHQQNQIVVEIAQSEPD